MPTVEVTIHYLELPDPEALLPAPSGEGELVLREAEIASPELGRFLYTAVGNAYHWTDRLEWSREAWMERLGRAEVRTWIGYVRGTPVGYVEMEMEGEAVEIVNLGLLPGFTGRGLGGQLLTLAVEAAWEWGAGRVWLHTCSLDDDAALPNYLARGFQPFRTETELREIPDDPPEAWPGTGPRLPG